MAFPFSFFSICGTALGVSRIGGEIPEFYPLVFHTVVLIYRLNAFV